MSKKKQGEYFVAGKTSGGNGGVTSGSAGDGSKGGTIGQYESSGDKIAPGTNESLTPKQQSAKQMFTDWLDSLGLGSLGKMVWHEYLQGTPTAKIMADVRASDAYAQRFPGMKELAKGGHAITEADYIAKESADMSLMRAYGLPEQMVNNRQELGKLIGGQVSTTELQSRLDAYKTVVLQLPHEVRDYLSSQGVNSGDLIGFWLNPDQSLPLLQNKVAAAEIGGAAAISGFGALDPTQAAHLAGLGVDFNQAMSGFNQAGQLTGLTQGLPGQAGSTVSRNDLVGAVLGQDANATLKVQRVQGQRKATFNDAANYAATQSGAVGLGASDQ